MISQNLGKNVKQQTNYFKSKMNSIFTSWSSYFPEIAQKTDLDYQNFTQGQCVKYNEFSIYIHFCIFFNMSNSDNGAALSITASESNNYCVLIELTSFSTCRIESPSKVYGGAIWIQFANVVLSAVCGYDCHSTYYEGFSHIYAPTSQSSLQINSEIDCSVTKCSSFEYYTTHHRNGHINISRVNFSNNKCSFNSAFECYPSNTFPNTNTGNIVSFCNIAQNNASHYRCIYLATSYDHEFMSTNIVSNNQKDQQDYGLLITQGKTTFYNSCIMKNIGSPIFHNSNGEFIIINCSVDENIELYKGKAPNIHQKGTSSFFNTISFIEIGSCIVDKGFHTIRTFINHRFVFIFLKYNIIIFFLKME